MNWAVRFEEVDKEYRRSAVRYRSLRTSLLAGLSALSRRDRASTGVSVAPRRALSGVNLEVQEGDSYALVGPNGAGKTTALRLVTRISTPTRGRVRVRGRVGALMEVGSGIHPELTGRENVRLYGSILGLKRSAIAERFDDIVNFAELGHVIDQQVRYYSSGMQLRLGFAIASHLEPDIFVVDEALAVGDAGFQARCVDRMSQLVRSGTTLLFVSHNLPAVEGLCRNGALIIDGKVQEQGEVKSVLARYLTWIEDRRNRVVQSTGEGPIQLLSATCHAATGEERYTFSAGDPIEFRFTFSASGRIERPHVNVGITDGRPGLLVQCSMLLDDKAPDAVSGVWTCSLFIESLPLRARLYSVFCDIFKQDGHAQYMTWVEAVSFRVSSPTPSGVLGVVGDHVAGPVLVDYKWDVSSDPA